MTFINRAFGMLFALTVIIVSPLNVCAQIFSDDFETGNLDNWVIGGRQQAGTNIADVETRHGSLMGHLFKFSFTEITFSQNFTYNPSLRFNFDLEVTASSTPPPSSAFYGLADVRFSFLDATGNSLGWVGYATATTSYPFDNVSSNLVSHYIELSPGTLHRLSLTVDDMLSHIEIDEAKIVSVVMLFRTYSSTHPNPTVTAELWVDNVCVDLGVTCTVVTNPSIDIDGNGIADALTDGILMTRYLFGYRGDTLVNGAVASDCVRCTSKEIEAWINSLLP